MIPNPVPQAQVSPPSCRPVHINCPVGPPVQTHLSQTARTPNPLLQGCHYFSKYVPRAQIRNEKPDSTTCPVHLQALLSLLLSTLVLALPTHAATWVLLLTHTLVCPLLSISLPHLNPSYQHCECRARCWQKPGKDSVSTVAPYCPFFTKQLDFSRSKSDHGTLVSFHCTRNKSHPLLHSHVRGPAVIGVHPPPSPCGSLSGLRPPGSSSFQPLGQCGTQNVQPHGCVSPAPCLQISV